MSNGPEQLADRLGLSIGEMNNIRDGIAAMIAKVKPSLAQTRFEMDTTFQDVGMDSLKVISVVFEIEEFFGIDIVGRHLEAVHTFGDTVTVVARLVAEMRGAKTGARASA